MKRLTLPIILVCLAPAGYAQLLPDHTLLDFQELVALYAKQYAPYEWKRDVLDFDMLQLAPWLDKVRATKDDLGFYEVCAAYVASLNDAHAEFIMDTDFFANLGFQVDLYDGKALIDTIDPAIARTVSFRTGDELISVDGKSVADWLTEFGRYSAFANQRSTDRFNASQITFREQGIYPRSVEVGDKATVVVRRKSTGSLQTYTMVWNKSGTPFTTNGPVPSPKVNSLPASRLKWPRPGEPGATDGTVQAPKRPQSKYLLRLQNYRIPQARALRGFDAVAPVFQLPSGFVRRLGRSTDFFFSGTFTADGKKIGYIRIPDFLDPTNIDAVDFAIGQFETEINFMQANTAGLVVDVMSNPGGLPCYAEALLENLIPYRFRGIGQEIRVTQDLLLGVSQEIDQADFFGFDQVTIDQLTFILNQMQTAYKQNRGRTDPLPACGTYFERDPATDSKGKSIAYTKPILLLTDEFTTSAAEVFSAIFQDSKRGPLFGWRTAGAGGSVVGPLNTGFYSESFATVTQSMLVRTEHVLAPGFPVTSYIENIGVRPDNEVDYMTEDNLTNNGKAFVSAFTSAMLDLLQ